MAPPLLVQAEPDAATPLEQEHVLAVPLHVVAPATHLSVCVEASPSSQLLSPHPAVALQEAAPAVPV